MRIINKIITFIYFKIKQTFLCIVTILITGIRFERDKFYSSTSAILSVLFDSYITNLAVSYQGSVALTKKVIVTRSSKPHSRTSLGWTGPTPEGDPVSRRSPGSRVIKCDT